MYAAFDVKQVEAKAKPEGEASLKWENCEEQIDLAALSLKEPILFYDEVRSLLNTITKHLPLSFGTFFCAFWCTYFLLFQVVLYEDELADNGVSLLTVKVVKKSQVFSFQSHFFHNAFDLIQVMC